MKLWSEDEIQFLRDNSHHTYEEIAKILNRTPMGVRFQFRKNKIKKIKKPYKIYKINEAFFEKWTFNMSYILGFTFADGSIRKKKAKSTTFRLYNSDLQILDKIKKIMQSDHPITLDKRTGTDYTIEIGRLKIVEDLEALGMTPRNSRTMKFPQVPDKFFFSFVRGYFDGDGHVKVSGKTGRKIRISFASGSKSFLSTLKSKLEERGIKCSMRTLNKGKEKESYQIAILKKGRKIFYHGLYGDDPKNFKGIKMESKYQLFVDYFEKNIKIQCLDCGITMNKTAHNHVRCKDCSHERDNRQKREKRKTVSNKYKI